MLNEVAVMARSLERYGDRATLVHPWVKRMGRQPTLVASLDESGAITRLEVTPPEEAVELPKLQQSNHANFPGVNIEGPLFDLAPGTDWLAGKPGDIRSRLENLRKACEEGALRKGAAKALKTAKTFC